MVGRDRGYRHLALNSLGNLPPWDFGYMIKPFQTQPGPTATDDVPRPIDPREIFQVLFQSAPDLDRGHP